MVVGAVECATKEQREDEGSGRADFGGADHRVERAGGTLIARSVPV